MTIHNFMVLGERCSGTNYLEQLISHNFIIEYKPIFGNKHFFCFNDYNNTNLDTFLVLGIIRNPINWINSFSKELYHIPDHNKSLNNFLKKPFYSICNENSKTKTFEQNLPKNSLVSTRNNKEILNKRDLNYINHKIYKNIFELRYFKNYYLINVIPKMVPNYVLLSYESISENFNNFLNHIQKKYHLKPKLPFFESISQYKKSDKYNFVKQRVITLDQKTIQFIWNNVNKKQELFLGYKP